MLLLLLLPSCTALSSPLAHSRGRALSSVLYVQPEPEETTNHSFIHSRGRGSSPSSSSSVLYSSFFSLSLLDFQRPSHSVRSTFSFAVLHLLYFRLLLGRHVLVEFLVEMGFAIVRSLNLVLLSSGRCRKMLVKGFKYSPQKGSPQLRVRS